MALSHPLPEVGLLRLRQIIGSKKHGFDPIIPISRSGWLNGVKAGRYPQPIKLGKCNAWRAADIRRIAEQGPDQ